MSNLATKSIPISLDEQLLADVITSVTGVFKEGFGLNVTCKSHHVARNQSVSGDVSGMVGLLQDRLEGNLIMSFSEQTIYAILSRVYARDFKGVDSIVREGAAEMANMVYGYMKTSLNGRGHRLKMALPTVVVGHAHAILPTDDCKSLVAAFEFDNNLFHVIVAVHDPVGT